MCQEAACRLRIYLPLFRVSNIATDFKYPRYSAPDGRYLKNAKHLLFLIHRTVEILSGLFVLVNLSFLVLVKRGHPHISVFAQFVFLRFCLILSCVFDRRMTLNTKAPSHCPTVTENPIASSETGCSPEANGSAHRISVPHVTARTFRPMLSPKSLAGVSRRHSPIFSSTKAARLLQPGGFVFFDIQSIIGFR